jgi:ABC-type uncharacterized transport system ATPase component
MLQLRELQKTFFAGTPNEVRALRGVSLQIDEGSFVIVIGTNGSGKSTLLNAVAGSFLVDRGTIAIAATTSRAGRSTAARRWSAASSRIPSAAPPRP